MTCTHANTLSARCSCGEDFAFVPHSELVKMRDETEDLIARTEQVFVEQRIDKLEIATLRMSADSLRERLAAAEKEAAELREMRNFVALALGMRIGSEVPDNRTMTNMIKERWGV